MIAAHEQCERERRTRFRIVLIQSNRPPRQFLGRSLHLRRIAALKSHRRMQLSPGEPPITAGEIRVELDASLKKLLRLSIFVRAETLHVPQPALKGAPSVKTTWWFAYGTAQFHIC